MADVFTIDIDLVGVVGMDNELVEGRSLGNAGRGRALEVLLFVFPSLGVLVTENEVNLYMSE